MHAHAQPLTHTSEHNHFGITTKEYLYIPHNKLLKKLIALKCFSHKLTMRINLQFNCMLFTYNTEKRETKVCV